jgi:DNA-binding beta-propeller fold protein YncE
MRPVRPLFALTASAAAAAVFLTACGDSPSQVGVLVDAPVEGVAYRLSSGESGMTDAGGRFNYKGGTTVTFSIDGVTLPVVEAKAEVTPLDMVGATTPDDPRAVALARFLQTLDADGNPDNGIRVDRSRLGTSAVAPAAWTDETDIAALFKTGVTVRGAAEARRHMASTLAARSTAAKLTLVGRYAPFSAPYTGDANTRLVAEIIAFHPASKSAFVTVDTTAEKSSFRRVDLSSLGTVALQNPTVASSLPAGVTVSVAAHVNDSQFTAGGVQSLDVSGNLLAIAVQAANKTDNGVVAFYGLDTSGNATFVKKVTVGSLPDGVAFSPDGKHLVVANEGELSATFKTDGIDPEGSISIISVSNGVPADTATALDFKAFNVGGARAGELPAGVRLGRAGATVAQDLEPEYVTVSADSKTAYVSLQENNAIAVVDLDTKRLTKIFALGYKDHGLARNRIAASDRYAGGSPSASAHTVIPTLKRYPGLYGVYMPDGVAAYTVGGKTYVLTANEGDDRDDFLATAETARVSSLTLDATAFPDGAALKNNAELGRLTAMAKHAAGNFGDTDADGDYDRLYVLGARSFSVFDPEAGTLVYDSGDDLERIAYNAIDDEPNEATKLKLIQAAQVLGRLDNKGPEPESVVIGQVGSATYAFVGLERASAIVVYDITDPTAPRFVQTVRNTTDLDNGDISPEGMKFVPATASPTGRALLLVGYEISGSLAVYQFD